MAGSLPGSATARALAAICAFVVVLGVWNAAPLPARQGLRRARPHRLRGRARPGRALPARNQRVLHTARLLRRSPGRPTGSQASSASGERHRAGSALNVLFLLGTVLLVWRIARELWPGRDRIAIGAAAFVAFVPVTVKAEAMFHPETLSLFVCTLAIWLCVRTFADRRYAFALGAALGAAQLVRAFGLWTVLAVAIALARRAPVARARDRRRPRRGRRGAVVHPPAADLRSPDRLQRGGVEEASLGQEAGELLPRPRRSGRR